MDQARKTSLALAQEITDTGVDSDGKVNATYSVICCLTCLCTSQQNRTSATTKPTPISMLSISIHGTVKGRGTPEQVYESTCSLTGKQRTKVSIKLVPDIPNPCSLQQLQAHTAS